MIQKTKFYFDSIVELIEGGDIFCWIACVDYVNQEFRDKLHRTIQFEFKKILKLKGDREATFPFDLEVGQTREMRLLIELAKAVNENIRTLEQKYRKVAFELIILKMNEKTLQPEFALASMPFFIGQTCYGQWVIPSVGDVFFKPFECREFHFVSQSTEFLSIPDIDYLEKRAQIFHWSLQAPEAATSDTSKPSNVTQEGLLQETIPDIGDAGFDVDFEKQG